MTDQLTAAEQEANKFRRLIDAEQHGTSPHECAFAFADLYVFVTETTLPETVLMLVQRVRDAEKVILNYQQAASMSQLRRLDSQVAYRYFAKYGKDKSQ